MEKPIYASKTLSSILIYSQKLEKLNETEKRYELLATTEMQAVAKIKASILKGARKYFDDNDYIN